VDDTGVDQDGVGGANVIPADVQALPRTGGNSGLAVMLGGLLLVLGLLLVRYGRPRQS
jgi:LPXTG-motif cell wall-anchored protein